MTTILTGTQDECAAALENCENDENCPYTTFEVGPADDYYSVNEGKTTLYGWLPMNYTGPLPVTYTPPE